MIRLLTDNPQFRRLWMAQVVSAIGDWLNRIAVLVLIGQLGHLGAGDPTFDAGQAQLQVGLMFAVEYTLRLIPTAIFSPLAGPIADRLCRRRIMVIADLARAAVVLCLLLVREPEHLKYVFVLIFLQMSMSIFFDSARSGALPNTVARKDLHAAYSLSAVTWSTMLALGGFLGGVLVQSFGTNTVFVADAATYLLSAALLFRLRLPKLAEQPEPFRLADVVLFRDLRRGFAHATDLGIARILLSKVLWSPCGGFVILFPLVAARYQPGEVNLEDAGIGIGLLFAARGIGTGLGPIVARFLGGSSEAALIRQSWCGMLVGALGYIVLPFAPSLGLAATCVTVAHMGGSAQWVGSTTYWQSRIDDAFRGRVFATEFLLMTLSFSVFALLSGVLYDRLENLDVVIWILVALTVTGGLTARKLFAALPRSKPA